jgi:glycerol uptake facilitator-like aquaporin
MFEKISMAHIQMVYYITAEIIGALLGSLFVKYGPNANLGANAPNYSFPIPVIFGIEVLASALLMAVNLVVVSTRGLNSFSGIATAWISSFWRLYLAHL